MNKFDIWIEGHAITGESAKAQHLGVYKGEVLQDACVAMLIDKKWDMDHYDANRNSYWACRFFDNETDARAGFG